MAKKPAPVIHPRTLAAALDAFHTDVNYLVMACSNLQRFMSDKDMDAKKVCKVGAEQLGEAVARVTRWYEAE